MIDGTRTRDNRNHNPGLYQLSYDHHSGGRLAYNSPNALQREKSVHTVKSLSVRGVTDTESGNGQLSGDG